MKLIVNLSPLFAPLTGIGHYTAQLLRRAVNDPRIEDIQGFWQTKWLEKPDIERLLENVGKIEYPQKQQFFKNILKKLPFARAYTTNLSRKAHKEKFERLGEYVYWETNYAPLFFTEKLFVSVYDLSYVRYPAFHPKSRARAFDAGVRKAVKKDAGLITISEFSKSEIQSVYGAKAENICIVAPGTDDRFTPSGDADITQLKQKYGLEKPYILSVATIEPRKNLGRTCRAYAMLPPDIKEKYQLVLAGQKGWLTDETEKELSALEKDGYVKRIGYVPDDELPVLYGGAELFVYMSLYEGYGMPVAEALQCGTKTLASGIEPMLSVGKTAAFYANPTDEDDIATKMLEALFASRPDAKAIGVHDWDEAYMEFFEILSVK